MRTKIISTVNIKGGVGKTTTIGAIAELLSEIGKKVLIIDMDPQANCSQLFRRYATLKFTINELLIYKGNEVNKENVEKCIQKTENPLIDIIAANEELTFTCNNITFDTSRGQQIILRKAINTIKDQYDYILIDNTPFFNILTINSLCASDYVLTPVSCDGYSYAGLTRLLTEINKIKEEFNENLIFLGAFMTNVNKVKNVFKDLYLSYKEELKDKFLKQYIRQDVHVEESITMFIPLISYSKKSNAAIDYRNLLATLNILEEEEIEQLLKTEDDIVEEQN